MKQVFTKSMDIEIRLKDGRIIRTGSHAFRGRYIYHYAEPEDKVETIFSDFEQYLAERGLLYSIPKRHNGRNLLRILCAQETIAKIYEDEIALIAVFHHTKVVDNPKWEFLTKDLGFNELTELLYNREQELKSMLTKECK